jgi:hypothetical protein
VKKKPAVTLTIIATPVEEPDSFLSMDLDARRDCGGGWKVFPVGSRLYLDSFLMLATDSDFGVFEEPDDSDSLANGGGKMVTCFIDRDTLKGVLPRIANLVEKNAKKTALALFEHGKKQGDLLRIEEALKSGDWPQNGDPAEEAAAFGHYLLRYARIAEQKKMGVCWEYRGPVEKRGV